MLWGRVYQVVRSEKVFLDLERRKLAQEEAHHFRRLKMARDLMLVLNFYTVLSLVLLAAGGVGVFIGVNLPEGVVCRERHTLCYHLRVRELRRVVEEKK
ncbi:MAG: hypothetical protein ACRDEA_14600 [Microcystaceae cyanobacterium]